MTQIKVTQKQFKDAVKEVAEKGKNVYYLVGMLMGMFECNDKETNDAMVKVIENAHK